MWHEAFNAPQINLWSENWPYLSSHYMTHHFNWIQDGQKSQESLTYLWASGDEHLRETTLKTIPTLHSLENRNNRLTNWAILCSEGCLLIRLDENLIHFGSRINEDWMWAKLKNDFPQLKSKPESEPRSPYQEEEVKPLKLQKHWWKQRCFHSFHIEMHFGHKVFNEHIS